MRTRLTIATLLVIALALGGCASTTSTAPAPAPLPAWSADAVGHGDKLLVLRTAQTTASADALEVDDLASGEATRVWAAPPGWDARLLCADRNGIAIALSRRGKSDTGSRVTTVPGGSVTKISPAAVDQQIVVLHADGTALRSSLPSGSIGIVSSAAFLGDTLVIARQGPVFHYETPAEPALMDSRGRFTLMPSNAIRLANGQGLRNLVTLPEGGVAAGVFQSYGPMPFGPSIGIVRLRGGSLEVTATAPRTRIRSPYEMAAGPTAGTVIFAFVYDIHGGRLPIALAQTNVFANPASDTVPARAVWPRWPSATGPAPEASMGDGRYLVAIDREVHHIDVHIDPAMARQLASRPATSATFSTIDASGRLHPTPVALFYERTRSFGGGGWPHVPADTWLWLGAFGR